MPCSQISTIKGRMGKCSVKGCTCYKSSKLKITSNLTEQRHLKAVVVFKLVFEPGMDQHSRIFLMDGQRKDFPAEKG